MINQLFSWDDWADISTTMTQYDDCVLKVPIGKYPAGARIAHINVDTRVGKLEICDPKTTRPIAKYPLLLTVGARNG